ncbi:unnamed protein product [Closterium sp. NIES-65]|nr:unnamed protein product [Closterium sp. NIES-65]
MSALRCQFGRLDVRTFLDRHVENHVLVMSLSDASWPPSGHCSPPCRSGCTTGALGFTAPATLPLCPAKKRVAPINNDPMIRDHCCMLILCLCSHASQPGFLDSGSRHSESTSSFASYDDLQWIRESLSSSSDDDSLSLSSGGASDIHDDDQDTAAFSLRKHITSEWNRKFQEGLFRYDVTACESKVIEGRLGFIAQLNEGRHSKKRPSEFPMDKVLQPFDPSKFNFTKAGQNEMLFRFEEGGEEESPSIVAINVSPIDYGHVLLIPRILDTIPQRIDKPSLLMALRLASEVNEPAFRIGYNSLGAFATINHLHFQAYFLDLPFAIECASSKEIAVSTNGCKVEELTDYPVKTLVFQAGACLEQMASAAAAACCELQERNIPLNLFIVDRGTRLFLIPQRYAERQARGEISQELLDTLVNPASFEIAGHVVCKRREDYDNASESWAWKLLEAVSLTEEGFDVIRMICVETHAASVAKVRRSNSVEKGKVEFVSGFLAKKHGVSQQDLPLAYACAG